MIFTAIFLRGIKILSCGNVPDGGWKFKAEQEHCMRVPTHDCSGA